MVSLLSNLNGAEVFLEENSFVSINVEQDIPLCSQVSELVAPFLRRSKCHIFSGAKCFVLFTDVSVHGVEATEAHGLSFQRQLLVTYVLLSGEANYLRV